MILESGFCLRSDRDEKRLGARALGVPVELRYLASPVGQLWQRIEARNLRAEPGTVPITRELLDKYIGFFQAPDPDEIALFDEPKV